METVGGIQLDRYGSSAPSYVDAEHVCLHARNDSCLEHGCQTKAILLRRAWEGGRLARLDDPEYYRRAIGLLATYGLIELADGPQSAAYALTERGRRLAEALWGRRSDEASA